MLSCLQALFIQLVRVILVWHARETLIYKLEIEKELALSSSLTKVQINWKKKMFNTSRENFKIMFRDPYHEWEKCLHA